MNKKPKTTTTLSSGQYEAKSTNGKAWDIVRLPSRILVESKIGSESKILKHLHKINSK